MAGTDKTDQFKALAQHFYQDTGTFEKAIVIDVFYDQASFDRGILEEYADGLLDNEEYIDSAPRNSLIVRMISGGAGKIAKPKVAYPFFPPHFCFPVKVGEQVWVLNQTRDLPYWFCRVPSKDHVDDINYTHADRAFDFLEMPQKMRDKNLLKANPEDTRIGKTILPGFPNGTVFEDDEGQLHNYTGATLPLGQPSNAPYEDLVFSSISHNNFTPEAVPRYTKRPGDLVLQGSNNALISLGQDRGWTETVRPGGDTSNATFAPSRPGGYVDPGDDAVKYVGNPMGEHRGTIDLVAGRGRFTSDITDGLGKAPTGTEPRIIENWRGDTETDKNPAKHGLDPHSGDKPKEATPTEGQLYDLIFEGNRVSDPYEGDPDFITDASRVYITEGTKPDLYFGTMTFTPDWMKAHGVKPAAEAGDDKPGVPAIVMKSNEIRIIARHTTAKTQHANSTDESGSIRIIVEDKDKKKSAVLTMLPGGKVLIDAKKIVIGDGRPDQVEIGDKSDQHLVLGELMVDAISATLDVGSKGIVPTYAGAVNPGWSNAKSHWDGIKASLLSDIAKTKKK